MVYSEFWLNFENSKEYSITNLEPIVEFFLFVHFRVNIFLNLFFELSFHSFTMQKISNKIKDKNKEINVLVPVSTLVKLKF